MKWGRLYEDDPPATLVLCRRATRIYTGCTYLVSDKKCNLSLTSKGRSNCWPSWRAAGRAGEREERATDDTHQRL